METRNVFRIRCSHSGSHHLGYNAVYPFGVNRRFGGVCRLQVRRISQSRNQREAVSNQGSFFHPEDGDEMSVDFQRTTWRYIPEYISLRMLLCYMSVKRGV
jgi:hypothetical protein